MNTKKNYSNQNLSFIPEEVFEIENLQELDVSYNQIQVGEYENLNGIFDKFDGVSEKIVKLSELEKLDLKHNQINEIPEYLTTLNSLIELDLSNNSIEKIPKSFLNLNLKKLDIRNNPICNIKGLNHNKSPREIMEFLLLNQDKDKVPLNEAKLLVLGDENAGKSSLIERMVHNRFNEKYNSTKGIDIERYQTDSNIKINIWDFAGQEITYQVHNLFMSQESLYLLVVDGQKEDDIVQHFNWLDTIGTHANYPPIIIVVTKYENNRTYRMEEDLYREKFSNIVDICYVSSKEGIGFDELKKNIFYQVEKLSRMQIPVDCIPIKKAIEDKLELDSDILEASEFRAICKKYDIIDKKERANIRTILNDIGTMIGLDRDDKHVINPTFIIDDIYDVIRSREIKDTGIMPLDDPDDNHQNWIVKFFIKNKIAFKIDKLNVMIPSRLAVNRPTGFRLKNYEGELVQKNENEVFEHGLNFRFRYIHGFKREILFDFMRYIYDNIEAYTPTYWANGICWNYDNIKIVILFNKINKTIDIHLPTFNTRSRVLFSMVRKEFRKINQSDNIFVVEEVAVIKDNQIVKYISYDFLKIKKRNSDEKVEIEIHQKPYNRELSSLVSRYEYIEDEVIDDSVRPLIITEGKTDWKHIKKALERFIKEGLYQDLNIQFEEYEDINMGDAELSRMVETYSKTKQSRKHIFIFDRDNNTYIKKYAKKEFNSHGNNVYSFCIPKISDELNEICIEFYYKKEDLRTEDKDGKRIFIGEEFLDNGNSICGKFVTPKRKTKSLDILDRDKEVYLKEDNEWKNNVAFSKNDFTNNVINEIEGFDNFDIEYFKLILDVIDKIVNNKTHEGIVDSYSEIPNLIHDMQNGIIYNFENINKELAEEIKNKLQEHSRTWSKAEKKALDRKVYIEGLLRQK